MSAIEETHKCYGCAFKHLSKARVAGLLSRADNSFNIKDLAVFAVATYTELLTPEYRNVDHLSLFVGSTAILEDNALLLGVDDSTRTELRCRRLAAYMAVLMGEDSTLDLDPFELESATVYTLVRAPVCSESAEVMHAWAHLPDDFADVGILVGSDNELYLSLLHSCFENDKEEENVRGEEERS